MDRFEILWLLVVVLGALGRALSQAGGGTRRVGPPRRAEVEHPRPPVAADGTGAGETGAGAAGEGQERERRPARPARRVEAGPRVPRPTGLPFPELGWPFDELFRLDDEEDAGRPVDGPPRPKPGVPRPRVRRRRPVGETPAAGPAAPRAVPSAVPSAVPEAAALLPAGSEGEPGGEGPLVAALGAGAGREEPEQGLHRPPASPAGGAAAWALSPLARAVAWSVILGPPRAYQPWRPVGWRRGV